jgi:hypothetical protein
VASSPQGPACSCLSSNFHNRARTFPRAAECNETSRQAAMAQRNTVRKAVVEQDMNAHKTRVAVTGPRNTDKMVARLTTSSRNVSER